jgi:hypothetical protein
MLRRLVSFLWGSRDHNKRDSEGSEAAAGNKRPRSQDDSAPFLSAGDRGIDGSDHPRRRPRLEEETSTPPNFRSGSSIDRKQSTGRAPRGALTVLMHNEAVNRAWNEPLYSASSTKKKNPQTAMDGGWKPSERKLANEFQLVAETRGNKGKKQNASSSLRIDEGLDDDYDPDEDGPARRILEDNLVCAQLHSNLQRLHVKPFLDFREEQQRIYAEEDALANEEFARVVNSVVLDVVTVTARSQVEQLITGMRALIYSTVVDIVRKLAPPARPGVLRAIGAQQQQFTQGTLRSALRMIPFPLDDLDRQTIAKFGLVEGMTEGSHRNSKDVVLPAQGFSIQRYQLSTLLGRSWLNDQVINYYFKLLESPLPTAGPRVTCLGSHFYSKLATGDVDGAARWTRRMNLFDDADVVFIVVNNGLHWTLCPVILEDETIGYMDSMYGDGKEVLCNVQSFLQREYERLSLSKMIKKRHSLRAPRSWRTETVGKRGGLPRQENGFDCGVFACQFGRAVARTVSLTPAMDFTQKDMPFLRQLMLLELIQGRLLERL